MGLVLALIASGRWLTPLLVVVNLLIIGVGILLYENIFSLFAVGGILMEKDALWLKKEQNNRLITLLSVPRWMIYNLNVGAYGAVVGNLFAGISIIMALIRYGDWRRGK